MSGDMSGDASRDAKTAAAESAAAILAKDRFWRARREAKPVGTKNFFLAKNQDSESTQHAFGRARQAT
jgi:hypothetical protein